MSPKPLPYREVRRRLVAAGFVQVGRKGSHVKLAKQTVQGTLTAIVPEHREIKGGTIRSILRQAGMTIEEFERL